MSALSPKYAFALWSTPILTTGYFETILGGSFDWNTQLSEFSKTSDTHLFNISLPDNPSHPRTS